MPGPPAREALPSPVPNCEGQGAPSVWFEKSHWGRGHPPKVPDFFLLTWIHSAKYEAAFSTLSEFAFPNLGVVCLLILWKAASGRFNQESSALGRTTQPHTF
jgi:hypothetical protein